MKTTGTDYTHYQLSNFLKKTNHPINPAFIFTILLSISPHLIHPIFASDAIYLKHKALVNQKEVYLSNISRIPDGVSDIPIFKAPEEPVTYTPDEIQKLLPPELNTRKVLGGNCMIIPLNKKFQKQDIEESFRREIILKDNIDQDSIRVTYLGDDLQFPGTGVELRWGNIPRNINPGQKIFTLDTYRDGLRIYSVRLKFLVELKVNAYKANKFIAKNTLLSEKDLSLTPVFVSESIVDYYQGSVQGMSSLTNLNEGDLIRKKHIREIRSVERGSNVDIYFTEGNLIVITKAVAKESGNTGDKIKVQSKSSGIILNGIITGEGKVSID